MSRQIVIYFLLAFCILSIGCFSSKEVKKEEPQEVPDMHTSRNSLDWPGAYVGIVPESNEGMFFYGIQLRENQNYELKKTYLEVNKPMEEFTGKFSWTNDDSAVDLERAELFQVQEFRLMKEIIYLSGGSPSEKYYFPQVDVGPLDGEISSELVGDWGVYKRIGEDGKWTDKTFSTLSFTKTGKIRGESACNAYYGTFSVPASQRLYLSPISSTKMACPNLSAEQEFLDALNKATYYYKFGEQLILISEDLKPLIWAMGIVK